MKNLPVYTLDGKITVVEKFSDSKDNFVLSGVNQSSYTSSNETNSFNTSIATNTKTAIKSEIENFDVVENFGVSIGNKVRDRDTKKINEVKKIEESINENMVVEGTTKLLSSVINNVVSSNINDINKLIQLSNNITFENIKSGDAGITIGNISQDSSVKIEEQEKSTQSISNQIVNDISKEIKETIKKAVDTMKEYQSNNTDIDSQATNLGDTISSIGETMGDTVSEVLDVSIGNSTNTNKNMEVNSEFNSKFDLERNFTLQKDDSISDELLNQLSNENITKATQETKTGQELIVKDVEVTGEFLVDDIQQEVAIYQVMNNIYNQTVLVEISTKIISDYDNNISNMIESNYKNTENKTDIVTGGDIYALGVAGKQVLEGIGEGATAAGEGLSAAARGIGKGYATGAEGIGKGASEVFGAMTGPLIAIGIGLLIIIIGYFMGKKLGWF